MLCTKSTNTLIMHDFKKFNALKTKLYAYDPYISSSTCTMS